MKRLSPVILLLATVALSACQFFAPAANDQTLVAQNAELGTQIAAVRSTATVDADRLQVTLEFFQTAIGHVDGQTQALQATMVAQGTLPASIDINAITPDIPITLTTPAPLIENNTGCSQIYGHDLTALESTFPKTGTKGAVVKAYTKNKSEDGGALRFRVGGPAAYDLAAQAVHMSGIHKIRSVLMSRTEIAQRLDVVPQTHATSTGTDDTAMTKLRPGSTLTTPRFGYSVVNG